MTTLPTSGASGSRTAWLRRWAPRAAAAYAGLVLAPWAAVRFGGDVFPWPTVLVFGPRWVVAVPLLTLVPAAAAARSRFAGVLLLASGVVVAGPVTGGEFGGLSAGPVEDGAARLRVLTCNTQGSALDGGRFARLLAEVRPDVVLVQEVEPSGGLPWLPDGWHAASAGNGVAVASRFPTNLLSALGPDELGMPGACGRFALRTPAGELAVVNLHLPTPRDGLEAVRHRPTDLGPLRAVIAGRDRASAAASVWAAAADEMTLVGGDFNMPVESRIYARDWGGLANAFTAAGSGWGYTKWTRWFGVRIDHVLYSPPWVCRAAWVGPDVGSDHRPLLADLQWTPAG